MVLARDERPAARVFIQNIAMALYEESNEAKKLAGIYRTDPDLVRKRARQRSITGREYIRTQHLSTHSPVRCGVAECGELGKAEP